MPMGIGREEQTAPARGPEEQGARTLAPRPADGAPIRAEPGPIAAVAPAHVLSLQALVGNRAACAVVARQPVDLAEEGDGFNPEHIVHTLRRAIDSKETTSRAPWWVDAVSSGATAHPDLRVRKVDEATVYRVLDGLTKTQVATVKRLYAAQSGGRPIEQDLFEGGESETPSDLTPLQRQRIKALLEGTRAEDPLGRPLDGAGDARYVADAVELHELATGDMKDAQIERVMQLHRRPGDEITKVDNAYELRFGKHLGTVLNDRLPTFMQNRLYQLRVGNLRLADAIALEHHRQKALVGVMELDEDAVTAASGAIRSIVEQNRLEALRDPANAGLAANEAIKRRLGPLMETQHEGFGTLGAALEDALGWGGFAAIKAMATGARPAIVAAERLNEMELRTRADLPGKTTHMAVAQLLRDLREDARKEVLRRLTDPATSDDARRVMGKEPDKAVDALAKAYIDEFVATYETIKGEDGRSYEAIMASADQPGEDLMRLLTAGHGAIDPVDELDIAIRKKDREAVKAVLNAQRTPDAVAALQKAYLAKRGEPLEHALFGRGYASESDYFAPGDVDAAALNGPVFGGLLGGRDAVLADESLTRPVKGGEAEVEWIESHGKDEMAAAKARSGWTGDFRRVGDDPETEVLMGESADRLTELATEWRDWDKADPWGRRPRHEILAEMRRWRATLTGDAAAYEEENARMRAQIRAAVSFAVQVALALALPGIGAGFVATTALNIAATVATNAVIYGEDYTLEAFRDDIVFGVAGAAGGKLADEAVGIIAGAVAADTAQATAQATTKAGLATTLAREADQAAGLAADASRLAVVGREAASILGGAAAVTAVGGTGQFDPAALAQGALMSIVGRLAPGARGKPGADGDQAGGVAGKDVMAGPSSRRVPRDVAADQAAAQMGHPGVGLRGAEALIRVADQAARLPEPAAGATLESYAGQVLAPINVELRRLGAAVPQIEVRDFGSPDRLALMDFTRNVIALNSGAMEGGRPFYDLTSAEGRQNVLSALFHEARHAEQLFHALRARVRFADNPAEAPHINGDPIDPAIVAAANARPLPPGGSAEAEMGRRAYDEYFGGDQPAYVAGQDEVRREQIRDDIRRQQEDRDRILQQVRGVYSRLSKNQQREVQELNRRMNELEQDLIRLDQVYWNLFVEVDARGAQADVLRELEPSRQNALAQRVRDAGDLLEQIRANAPEHERAALANLVAAMRNYQREMERLRRSLPPPPAPATTGGGSR